MSTAADGANQLSPRELDVLRLIAQGLSNEEICQRLFVSANTVKSHIRNLYQRIGVERRSQAVVWAYRHGVVDFDEADEDEAG